MIPSESMAVPSIDEAIQAVLAAALKEPVETSLRLEAMSRSLGAAIEQDPEGAAEVFVDLERERMSKGRQIEALLGLLAKKYAEIGKLSSMVEHLPDS